MRRASAIGIVVSIAAVSLLAAGGLAQRAGRVLHRPLPGDPTLLEEIDRRLLAPPASPDAIRRAAGPGSTWQHDQPLDDTVVRPRDSWQAPLRELDRHTQSAPGTRLAYQEVFTPSIAPFKRAQAYDLIDEMGRLTIRDPSLRAVAVGDPVPVAWRAARRVRFVGEVLVELSPAFPTPVPGVAGEQRVVSYSTSTGQPVEFAQDSAGNLYVRSVVAGTVRLTYVLEAPDFAFQAPYLPRLALADAAASLPESARPAAPGWLRASARTVLAHVGLAAEPTLDTALEQLVGYFRAFRDGELPDSRGPDMYTDLALGGVGACRHRAYALMATLTALRIPSRYVGNEAHAWVEVFLQGLGWTRVDLGGWDVPLDDRSPSSRQAYRPRQVDPFPTPPEYTGQYSAAANTSVGGDGGVATLGPESDDVAAGADPRAGSPQDAPSGGAPGRLATPRAPGPEGPPRASNPPRDEASTVTDSAGDDGVDVEPVHTVLSLTAVQVDETAGVQSRGGVVRGSMVRVAGQARDARGAGVGGLAVEVELWRGQRVVHVLGATVTRPDGRWEAHVLLPGDVRTGEYVLRANTPGDARHRAATAE